MICIEGIRENNEIRGGGEEFYENYAIVGIEGIELQYCSYGRIILIKYLEDVFYAFH